MRSLRVGSLAILLCLAIVPGGRSDAEQKIIPLVIAETGRACVIEIDKVTGKTTWEIRGYYANSVQRLPNGNTLICDNRRVVEFTRGKRVAWRSPLFGESAYVNDAKRLANGNTLICVVDYPYSPAVTRVLEMRPWGQIVWSYEDLWWATEAVRLPNGNTLIVDGRSEVFEVTQSKKVVWDAWLNECAFSVERLPNGNTLVGEYKLIEEINPAGKTVWRKRGMLKRVGSVQRLKSGNTLPADPDNNRVVEIDPRGVIVWARVGLNYPWAARLVESTPLSGEAPDPGLFQRQSEGG